MDVDKEDVVTAPASKKPFTCSTYNKEFVSEKNLSAHIEKFYSVKYLSCSKSDKAEKTDHTSREHIEDVHAENPQTTEKDKKKMISQKDDDTMDVDKEDVVTDTMM